MWAEMAGLSALMLIGTSVVLLIACANVAGLFLARGQRRHRELAVRAALGAGRSRLLRLLFLESGILAAAGGGLGIYLAAWAGRFFQRIPIPLDVPLRLDVPVDGRVVTFAVLVSVGSACFFGLMPALRSARVDLVPALRSGGTGHRGAKTGRLRQALVITQVAGAVLLVSFAGLFLRSLSATAGEDLGVDPSGLVVASVALSESHSRPDDMVASMTGLARESEELGAIAEAEFASVADGSLWDTSLSARVVPAGLDDVEGDVPPVTYNAVSPGYFRLVGLAVVQGRAIGQLDVPGAPLSAVVNETFARRFWGEANVVGNRFTVLERRSFGDIAGEGPQEFTVVGVAKDVAASEYGAPVQPHFWGAFAQIPSRYGVFVARAAGSEVLAVQALRTITQPFQESVVMVAPQTLTGLLRFKLLLPRLASQLLTIGGVFTLLLAVVGIHGIVSYAASQRVREMAIRRAVGASGGQVMRSILSEGLILTAIGVGCGLLITVVLSTLVRSVLSGVGHLDPLALGGSLMLLLLTAGAAGFVPARKAQRVHPMTALREE